VPYLILFSCLLEVASPLHAVLLFLGQRVKATGEVQRKPPMGELPG
jgi:hypothetical protein